ncbi:uncharacterized protein EDB91DRAFT_1254371 [Suillus paluster]|uniref:uncharacterized protein n=1 Tax=Suillus paluster TaxID=48578 RepID=UPI001B884ED1|nr:uncharacterized protein EDB91DRAFT_1254371 [Suillus paluster]KAG1726352.1 hypothetical protein EDB91DRAFT_1254371 [Suillus paluster]
MSTPVADSLTDLKNSTAQIMAIISTARQIPPGPSHSALGKQIGTLVSNVAKEYGSRDGPIPGLIILCLKELHRIRSMVPKVWPDWHTIGYDDPRILRHAWYPKVLAWEALGDWTFDLPTAAPPSTGPIPVNLPSPAIPTGNVAGPSTNPTTKFRDKGKGKAVFADLEPEAEGSNKRKSPLILGPPSQPPKSVMKSHKHQRLACVVKSKPMKNPCYACNKLQWPCTTRMDKRTGAPCMSCIYCTTKKIKCTPASMGSPPPRNGASSTTRKTRSRTSSRAPSKAPSASQTPAPSKAPPASQSKARTHSQSRGPSGTPGVTAVTTPKTQMHGRSKTITAVKAPAPEPAPLPASSSAVPAAACGPAVPAAALARIALLEDRVAEQDGKIDTLQRLHEGLRHEIMHRHPSFPLPDPPANASSLLLDQSGPPTMSPAKSALPLLIDLTMEGIAPTTATATFPDASAIDGLLFDYNQVAHPEDPDASGEIVNPGDPSNLVPEYDSSDDMDVEVEVKVEESSEEVDMAT